MARRERSNTARLVAVGGGKGGVGKSLIALNLAAALARMGHRTVIVDADLGAANLHTLAGVTRPGPGIAGFLDHEVDTLDAAAVDLVPNLRLVAGTSRPGAANLNHGQKVRLLRALAHLAADVVVIDVGAGAAYNTLDFVAVADVKLIVMTPELTSLHNAYASLKACVQRVARRLPDEPESRAVIGEAFDGAGEARPIRDTVAALRTRDAVLADRVIDMLVRFGVGLVANRVDRAADAAVITRMSRMISDYLLVDAPILASLPTAQAIRDAIRDHRTAILDDVRTRDGIAVLDGIRGLACAVLAQDVARLRAPHRRGTLPIWIERSAAADN